MGWIDSGKSSATSAWPTASASAPSTCARSPSTPATTAAVSAAAGQRREAHGLAHAVEQQVAGLGEVAADDEALRVEQVEHERRGAADDPAGVGDHAPAAEVALVRQAQHLGDGQVAVAAAQHLEQRAGRGGRLEAAAVAAAADGALGVDEDVAELAGHAAGAAVEPPAEDQPRADAGRELEVDEVRRAASRAVGQLGQRAEVRVVVDADRDVEPPPHLLAGGHADPARAGSPRSRQRRRRARRAGQPEAGADHARALDAGLGERLADQVERHVEALVRRVVDVHRRRALGEDVRRQVADGHAHVAVAEVDAERGAGRRVERQQDRRAAALLAVRRALLLALDDEPVGLQVGDEARDRRAGEPGAARDVGTADHAVLAQRVDHATAIEPAQRRQRALRPLPHPVWILTTGPMFCQVLALTTPETRTRTSVARTNSRERATRRRPSPAGRSGRRTRRPASRAPRARARPRR